MAGNSRTNGWRALAVELQDADQQRYRDTAWADTKAILGDRLVVVLIALVALAGTEASAFLSSNELTTFEKVVLAALAAGVGALVILWPCRVRRFAGCDALSTTQPSANRAGENDTSPRCPRG